ncbi:MAG: copper resistance protein B [Rhodanobacter sp.]
MSMHRSITSTTLRPSALLTALLLALPLVATAQQAPDVPSGSATTTGMGAMSAMDHSAMDHGMERMTMPASPATSAKPTATKARKKKSTVKPASPSKTMGGMPDMDHGSTSDKAPASKLTLQNGESGTVQGMDHRAMPDMSPEAMKGMGHSSTPGMSHGADHGTDPMAGMPMGPMQGGSAPADARSPDYSDGLTYGAMEHMNMHGRTPVGMLLIDQFEVFDSKNGSGQTWEAQGWYGNDVNKLWVRTEGDRSRGKIEDGDVEVFWNRNVATFWSTQLGVRHELGDGPTRNWAAFGIQGLAPYWFELEATAYVGSSGRTAARLRAEYELLFTQRLILQPEFEVNLYGKSDPARRIGSGVSDAQLGLRLRYEIRRQFAPYVGVVWTRRFGATADFARIDNQATFDRQWVAGLRIWF